jgi:1-acyl-sn-glycerol-3-phosphate acyltransferase
MMPYSVPLINRLARRVGRTISRLFFHLFSDVKISGSDYVPKKGPYTITINHFSFFKRPFIPAFQPTPPEAADAIDILSQPGQGILAWLYGWIPVHRGEFDWQLLDKMISVLQSGRRLLLALEGDHSHDLGMRRAHSGLAYIAEKIFTVVVPAGIDGTIDDYLYRAIHFTKPWLVIRIGKPLILPSVDGKGAERREALQTHPYQIMLAMATLVSPEYRGACQILNEAE